jgi:hypothetical protein
MDIGRELDRYFDALAAARAPFRAPGAVTPFVFFALLQVVILLAMSMFTVPWLAPVMVPVMRTLGGEESLHYPIHFISLPAIYQRIYLPLVASVGFGFWTFAVWKLVDGHRYGTQRGRPPFRPMLGHAMLIGVLFVGTSVLVSHGLSSLVTPKTPGMVVKLLLLVSVALTAAVQTFLVYAPVALRLRGENAWRALRTGARYARRNFLSSALLITTVLLVHLPLDFLLARADRVAARFSPETVLQLMLGSVTLEMVTAFVLFAGVTELALSREGGLS